MSSFTTNGSPQLEFLRSFYQAIEQKDADRIQKHLHKDFSYNLYPRSLGLPVQTGEEWLKSFVEFMSLWDGDSKLTFHSVVETPGRVVVHATGNAKSIIGKDVVHEMVLTKQLTTDEDGSLKIKHCDEFVDSKSYLEFFKAVQEAKAKEHSASAA